MQNKECISFSREMDTVDKSVYLGAQDNRYSRLSAYKTQIWSDFEITLSEVIEFSKNFQIKYVLFLK